MDMKLFFKKNLHTFMQKDISSSFSPEFFEKVPCNFCGAEDTDADVLFEADVQKIPKTEEDFRSIYSASSREIICEQIIRCRRCGLIYLSPRPRRKLILSSYTRAEDTRYASQEKSRMLTFNSCLKVIKRLRPEGRLLDIGSATGIFVKLAKDAGYKAYGVEPSFWMCKIAKESYNVTILPGPLESIEFKDSAFDIITMWDVLEHVCNPMDTLKEVKRILKPGGFLVINYPRIDDPLAKLFGKHWWFLLSVHLFYFTPKTLSAYTEQLGLKKILHRMHFQRLTYGYLVERLNVYSDTLAKIAKLLYIIPGLKKLSIVYFASQYMMILRKQK